MFNKLNDDEKHFAIFIAKAALSENLATILKHSNCIISLSENEQISFNNICECVTPALQSVSRSIDTETILRLYIADKCNSFALAMPLDHNNKHNRSPRAYVMYDHAAYFNHSCLPNCVRIDEINDVHSNNIKYSDAKSQSFTNPPSMIIQALSDISPGTELTISYVPLDTEYGLRSQRLRTEYGFDCDCERCVIERFINISNDEIDDENCRLQMIAQSIYLVKYSCTKCGGTLCPISGSSDQKCNVCGIIRTEQEFKSVLDAEFNDSDSEMSDNISGDEDL